MKKRVLAIAVSVMMAATLFTGCLQGNKKPGGTTPQQTQQPAAGNKKVIKVSIGLNEQHPEYAGIKKFEEIVESKSQAYDVQLYPNATLGDDKKAMESLRSGTLEVTVPSTSPLAGAVNEFMVFDLPFLFPNEKVADAILDGPIGQKLFDTLPSKGMVGLAYWENGFRQLTNSKKEVKTPADLAGMKVRTMENPIHLAAWKALGANPTPMPMSEVFTALQQHTIDGQENPIPTIYGQKFYEVQKYTSLTKHVYTPFIFLFSKKVWDVIPAADQEMFKAAAIEAGKFQREANRKANSEGVDALRKAGMTVTEIPDADLKAFQDKVKGVYAEYADKIGKDLVQQVQDEVAKASK